MRRFVTLVPLVFACSSTPATPPCGADATLVVLSDYQSSESGAFVLPAGAPALFSGSELGGDPVLATSAGRSFFVARDRGTFFELDACGKAIASFSAIAPGDPAYVDPYDVAVLGDGSLFVPRFETGTQLVLEANGAVRGVIDLSMLGADGVPNASAAVALPALGPSKALVLLDRLEHVKPYPLATQTALAVLVDATTLTVGKTIDLGARNPFGRLVDDGAGSLWVAAAGNFASATEQDAGIVRIDPTTLSPALMVAEPALEGSATEVAVRGGCGVAIVADASSDNRTSVVGFDPVGGTVTLVMGPTPGFDLRGLAWTVNADRLLVGDRRSVAGKGFAAHVFARSGSCDLSPVEDVYFPLPPIAFRP